MTPLPKNHIINTANSWRVVGDDFLARNYIEHNPAREDVVQRVQLANIDARIPIFLDALISASNGEASASKLLAAVAYWSAPDSYRFMSNNGSLYSTNQITKLKRHAVSGVEVLSLQGIWRRLGVFEMPAGETAYYPLGTADALRVDVTGVWLDAHYPGWRERSDLSESLDLTSPVMTDFILGLCTLPNDILDPPYNISD